MDRDVFQRIMRTDPVILLRSDVAAADDTSKAALVEALLASADNEEWIDRDWSLHASYSKLKHPGLADQLRLYITDNQKSYLARRIATDIAEWCEVKTLQEDLAHLALDESADVDLRVNAAYAVTRIADSQTKAKLRPLAFGEAGDDPADELKGRGLRAIWPNYISSSELLSLLSWPKRPSLYGSYKSFLDALANEVDRLDLVVALRWLRERNVHPDPVSAFRSLRNEILKRAWQNLGVAEIREALADLIADHARKLRGDQDEKIFIEDDKRRQLLGSVIQRLAKSDKATPWYFLVYDNQLVNKTDVPWLIDRIRLEESPEGQSLLADILGQVFDWSNTEHVRLVIEASGDSSVIANTFRLFLNPVYLDSEQAAAQRKAYAESQEWSRSIPEDPPLDPPAAERVRLSLESFESGDVDAWWRLNLDMTLPENSRYYGDVYESNLKVLPGWVSASDEMKSRILISAKKYLIDGNPDPAQWVGKDVFYWPAYAGYRAFRLILDEEPDFISALPAAQWRKWAPILVGYPLQNEVDSAEIQQRLIASAYQHAPDVVIETLLALIDQENKKDGFISVLSHLTHCWDERLSTALMNRIKQRRFKTRALRQLLAELLENDSIEAKRYAEAILKRKPASEKGQERRRMAARVLVTHAADSGWRTVWPLINKDAGFGRHVVEGFVGSIYRRKKSIAARLNDDELGDLFLWLAREYSYATDPRHEGVHAVSPNDEARSFRNSVLNQLKERGTPRAVAAIEMLVRELPELSWLKWTLVEARENSRRRNWIPLQPAEILKIAHEQDSRLVQNGNQLLDVLVDSLKRLQQTLHGETAAAIFLWNKMNGVFQPKDENELSNYVKLHLDGDLKKRGIIANREVQIRRGDASFKGQATDIHVDAVTKKSTGDVYDQITVIIETKGSWNRDLYIAMETQLKNRYLRDHHSPYGLYLVGWFNCPQWNKRDPRNKQSSKIGLKEVREKLSQQAASLSTNGTTLRAIVLNASLPSDTHDEA